MNESFKEYLIENKACSDAVKWVGDKTRGEAWEQCTRADWMMWLLAKEMKTDEQHKTIVSLACDFAESVLHLIPKGEERPRKALEATRAWIEGKASLVEVKDAADAAYADAAYAAAYAAAVYAAYADAAYAAAAWESKHVEMCAHIRKVVG